MARSRPRKASRTVNTRHDGRPRRADHRARADVGRPRHPLSGPKEYDRLEALGLEGAVNFGGFPIPRQYGGLPMEWIGVPILKLMNWLYRYIPNYGVVIILSRWSPRCSSIRSR